MAEITVVSQSKEMTAKQTYIKGNLFIDAKYNSSPLTDKMLATGLTYLAVKDSGITTEISAKEIMHLMGNDSGSMYEKIKKCANELSHCQIIIQDIFSDDFVIINMFQRIAYINGVIEMKFSEDMSKYICALKTGTYQTFNLPLMMAFEEWASFRLFELIKLVSYMATEDTEIETPTYSMGELFVKFNLVDMNNEEIKKFLSCKNPDYDEFVELFKGNIKHGTWDNFKRRILEPAIEEISKLSEYSLRYEKRKNIHNPKYPKIVFYVKKKKINNIDTEEIIAMIDELKKYIKEDLTTSEFNSLLKNSNYNVEHIKKCYDIATESKSEINDLVAWLHAAIMNPSLSKQKKIKKKNEKKNSFNNIESRNYDFDELEKKMIKAQSK